MYSFTPVRNSMKPSVTVSRKISVETAQKTNVCAVLAGPYSPKLNDTCHTTSVSRIASRTRPEPKRYRLRMLVSNVSIQLYGLQFSRITSAIA